MLVRGVWRVWLGIGERPLRLTYEMNDSLLQGPLALDEPCKSPYRAIPRSLPKYPIMHVGGREVEGSGDCQKSCCDFESNPNMLTGDVSAWSTCGVHSKQRRQCGYC